MKVSYIPDFGYSEQLNFSIDSQVNNVEEKWKMLANQILMPFAPKYSVIQRAMQASHRQKELNEKKANKKEKKVFQHNRALQHAELRLKNFQNAMSASPQREHRIQSIRQNVKELRKIHELKSTIKSIKEQQLNYQQNIKHLLSQMHSKVTKAKSERALPRKKILENLKIKEPQTRNKAFVRAATVLFPSKKESPYDLVMSLPKTGEEERETIFDLRRSRANSQSVLNTRGQFRFSQPLLLSSSSPSQSPRSNQELLPLPEPPKKHRRNSAKMSSRVLKSIQKLYPGYIEETGGAKTARQKEEKKQKPRKKKTYVRPSTELQKMVDFLTTEPTETKDTRLYTTRDQDTWRENALDSSRLEELPSPPAIDNGKMYETYMVKSPSAEGQWFKKKRRHFSSKAIL